MIMAMIKKFVDSSISTGGLQAAGGDRQVPPGGAGLPAQQEHHPLQHQAGEHHAGAGDC